MMMIRSLKMRPEIMIGRESELVLEKQSNQFDAYHLDGVHGGGDEDEHDGDGGDGGRV